MHIFGLLAFDRGCLKFAKKSTIFRLSTVGPRCSKSAQYFEMLLFVSEPKSQMEELNIFVGLVAEAVKSPNWGTGHGGLVVMHFIHSDEHFAEPAALL